MSFKFTSLIILTLSLSTAHLLPAQKNAEVREDIKKIPTYDFSDPDPVPNIGRIYPYYGFDGYSSLAEEKEWNIVELENDYIKVFITPEIGGKIWGALEKSTGKEFIYFNHVVKFRDVAMRGPWTSGGIELNFGAIGHAPTSSSPVDYFIRKNEDGSVSCFLGAIDLASRTEWRVEVNLPADKSWFTTRALWHNSSQMPQSYYQWMNAGVKTAGNPEYAYPGTNYIGHDGSLHNWPNHKEGIDLSWYENNNFGGYKSYHVLGELTNFFGGYWHDDDFGFGHYTNYDGKPGKKLWIWGLSRQGMIWENLLTDTDGQYTEIQSGRLFNQEASNSIYSPFKHRSFPPLATDEWTEYWFPVMTTQGVVQAIPRASINLKTSDGMVDLWLSANEFSNDNLIIAAGGKTLATFNLSLEPTQVFHQSFKFSGPKDQLSVKLGTEYIIGPGGRAEKKLNRPLQMADFDWQSVQGLYMKGQALEQERSYNLALEQYLLCLKTDPNYLPAIVGAAGLFYRKADYAKALKSALLALSIDTYYPSANYLYGLINLRLGNEADAIDGFSVASASVEYKSAAFLELARIYLRRGEYEKSTLYARKSLDFNRNNISATELLLVSLRKSNADQLQEMLDMILLKDPLNHFARFEQYLSLKSREKLNKFNSLITNELPHETYIELALKYYQLGLISESQAILKNAPSNAMISYWLAYLNKDLNSEAAIDQLNIANDYSPDLVFPFRQESISALEWAIDKSNSWKPKYYLALIWWNLGNIEKAKSYFNQLLNVPEYFPYYLAKAELFTNENDVVDQSLEKAYELSPNNWRPALALSNNYINKNDFKKAIKIVRPMFNKEPANYYLGLNYAKALMLDNQNNECLDLLQNLIVLPNEGATEGHHLFRLSSLNIAAMAIGDKEFNVAHTHLNLARSWPENLGVGKPYITDERIEKYLEAIISLKTGNNKKAQQLFENLIVDKNVADHDLISAEDIAIMEAHIQLDQKKIALESLKKWQESTPDDPYVHYTGLWMDDKSKELTSELKTLKTTEGRQTIGSRESYLQWFLGVLTTNQIKK